MEYIVTAYTDTGNHKNSNQDALCVRRALVPNIGEILMAVICDGMGGLQKGEFASAVCVHEFGNWFDHVFQDLPKICSDGFERIRREWIELLSAAHQKLLNFAELNQTTLGTTISVFFTFKDQYIAVSIGDSRIYEKNQKLTRITYDQSLVALEVARGRITEEEAKHHPQKNVLLQCIGAGESVTPIFYTGIVKGNTFYVLCTDGFIHELSDDEINNILSPLTLNTKGQMSETLRNMVDLCKERGEPDDITAILIKTKESTIGHRKCISPKDAIKRIVDRNKKQDDCSVKLIETAQIVHADNEAVSKVSKMMLD